MDGIARILTLVFACPALAPTHSIEAQDPAPTQPPAQARTQGQAPVPAEGQAKDPAQTPAQTPGTDKAATTTFTTEQLEQIVAPIALHPDSLLSMILMASTYPLEVVEAHRWVQKNPSVTGKALEEALKKHDWDPSVKSICAFPSVLKQMNDNLDWTQDLGDAFLGQKAEVMQTVQKMRHKALEAGNLKSTEQQKVKEDGDVIIIESTKTEVVYVPTYSPTVVYGPSWYYPTYYYPPMYVAPAPGAMLFAFSVGVAWGGCWGGCNWHGNDVDIDINNFNNFERNTSINPQNRDNRAGNKGSWNHSPEHRKGANYKNPQTAQKYGGSPGSSRVTKDQARGYDRGGQAGSKAGPSAGTRPATANAGTRPSGGTGAAGAGDRAGTSRPSTTGGSRTSGGSSALSGSRSPSLDRSASTRGATSRSGGGSRGGGGGGRGGGGGGRRR